MSVQPNPVRRQAKAVPAGLSRWLLLCRFDFRQKSWELPTREILGDTNFLFPADSAALASTISQTLSGFSDPSLGGATPEKTATCRIVSRHAIRQLLGKTKQPNKQRIRLRLQQAFQTKGDATRVVDLLHRPRCNPATI